ncbi:MAG: glycosyltransferase family 2 protein [Ruminococcaceae bacterium]|nr:glycosyltransferase family 2 protein [Oscillospiraceae bacterium]
MKTTKFYILIPVYNVEQYLDACLTSILSQDYSKYEVILVNDGSKDSSGKICDRYANENECVHVIHKENGGQISARLSAIDFIREKCEYKDTYSIFVDSDDELKVGALKTINEKIVSTDCDMLIYGYEKFNRDGICYTTLEEKNEEMLIDNIGNLFCEAIIEHSYNSLCRKAVRTEMLFFDIEEHIKSIQMGEDLLQSLLIYKQNPRTLITPDILYRYRINFDSITHTFKLKRFTDELSSRYYTVRFIKELNIWSDNDFDRYLKKSLTVIEWDIRHILLESPSRKDALNNLRKLYEHSFVQEYCIGKYYNKSSVWFGEFSKGHFRTLWILHKISMIKNAVKEKIRIGRK